MSTSLLKSYNRTACSLRAVARSVRNPPGLFCQGCARSIPCTQSLPYPPMFIPPDPSESHLIPARDRLGSSAEGRRATPLRTLVENKSQTPIRPNYDRTVEVLFAPGFGPIG